MSRPDGVTGCESDEISQKMCLGDAVGASDLQMLDAPLFQKRIPGFCADAQYLAHLVDVQHIRVIPEHHTVRITGIQILLVQIILILYTYSYKISKQLLRSRLETTPFSISCISFCVLPVSFRAFLVMVLGCTVESRAIRRSRLYSSRYIATKRVTPWRIPDRKESESPHHASTMIFRAS